MPNEDQNISEIQNDQSLPQNIEYSLNYPQHYYEKLGFTRLPDGCFIDLDGFKFDQNGFDASGGYFDQNMNYVPGDEDIQNDEVPIVNPDNINDNPNENNDYYDDEDEEEKYTKEYIEFVSEQKLPENIEYVNSSNNEYVYLMIGNLSKSITKQELATFLTESNINIEKLMILMHHKRSSTIARLEVYDKTTAIDVLNLWGKTLNDLQIVADIDEENEQYYYGGRIYFCLFNY